MNCKKKKKQNKTKCLNQYQSIHYLLLQSWISPTSTFSLLIPAVAFSERFLYQAGDVPAGQTPLWRVHFHRVQYPWTIRFTSPSPSNTSCPGHYSRHISSQHQRLPCQLYSRSWRGAVENILSFLPSFLYSFLHGDAGSFAFESSNQDNTMKLSVTSNNNCNHTEERIRLAPTINSLMVWQIIKVTPMFCKTCLVKILFQSRIWVWNLALKVDKWQNNCIIIEKTL